MNISVMTCFGCFHHYVPQVQLSTATQEEYYCDVCKNITLQHRTTLPHATDVLHIKCDVCNMMFRSMSMYITRFVHYQYGQQQVINTVPGLEMGLACTRCTISLRGMIDASYIARYHVYNYQSYEPKFLRFRHKCLWSETERDFDCHSRR